MISAKPLIGDGCIRGRDMQAEPLHTISRIDSAVVFDHRRWVCEDAELTWTAPHHLIVLTEQGGTSRTWVQAAGQVVYDGRDRPGALTFVPAGAERSGFYREVDLHYSALWIDPGLPLSGCERLSALPTLVNGSEAGIGALLASLRSDLSSGHRPHAVYIEHLVALVILRLAMLDGTPPPAPRHGRLGRKTLGRVEEYVEANIGADISLSSLARIADMPVDTFARRFKASTGQAPYAFVTERRVRRAAALLGRTDMAIGAIAYALGFSSQSHFTTTFRRTTGTTPRAYRAQFFPES
jgi:AraC family transcriptional regulator